MAKANLYMYQIDYADMSLMLFCAFRYALGRATYVPRMVMDVIEANIHIFTDSDIQNMVKEIDDSMKHNSVPLADSWLYFRAHLLTYKENRTKLEAEVSSPSGDNSPE